MASEFVQVLRSDVGIQRDGTPFDSTLHIDGSWVRFYRSRPQKIGGYQLIASGNTELIRNLFSYDESGFSYYYLGRPSTLAYLKINTNLTTSTEVDVTPAGFLASTQNSWTFTTVYYDGITYLIANATPSIINIGNTTATPVYYGIVGNSTPLVPLVNGSDVGITTAGGVTSLGNYIIVYGNNGTFYWNDGATLTGWDFTNQTATLGNSPIIYGAPVRSGTSATGIFWTLNSLIQLTFQPSQQISADVFSTATFIPSFLSTRITVMSENCIVSLDPNFFWVGTDSFWMYNGAVSELPNEVNKQWFFENINQTYIGKTFGYAITKYNEIWWVFCKGTSTEPNHAIVYNIQTGNWYDTDQISRAAGQPAGSVVTYPILTSSAPVVSGGSTFYPIYAHEKGTDAIGFQETAVPIFSYITSRYFNMWTQSPSTYVLDLDTVIPDIKQTGEMYFYVSYLAYPNSLLRQTDNYNFTTVDQFKTVRVKGSYFSITFASNVSGGSYVMGNTMMKMIASDDQRPGPTT